MRKHFQKPIKKPEYVEGILTFLAPKEMTLEDVLTLETGLLKMNRTELSILFHYLWNLNRKSKEETNG